MKGLAEIRRENATADEPMCRICGCVDDDCANCIRRTGTYCYWVEPGLCSACACRSDVIVLELHPKALAMIEVLVRRGLWGTTPSRVAEGFVCLQLRELPEVPISIKVRRKRGGR